MGSQWYWHEEIKLQGPEGRGLGGAKTACARGKGDGYFAASTALVQSTIRGEYDKAVNVHINEVEGGERIWWRLTPADARKIAEELVAAANWIEEEVKPDGNLG